MSDPRLRRMAQVLVRYSLGLKQGDRFAITATPLAASLVRELVQEALRVGAYPETFITLPNVQETFFKEGSDDQLRYISPGFRAVVEEYEAMIEIAADENTKILNSVDPSRLAVLQSARSDLMQTFMRRSFENALRWCTTLFPTNAFAQDTGLSLHDFEDFVYRACFLDEDDPVARWEELSRQQEKYVQWLNGKHTVHLLGPDTDLSFSIDGRVFVNCDGRRNFPDGEFFTGPVEDSVNGYIRYTFPASYQGRSVEDVRLRFENGVVVEASAAQGQNYLEALLGIDQGARRLGEFAFGNNPYVDRCTRNILFDEKMGGTVHLALGNSIPESGGVNQSALHWDMVCDLRAGSEIRVDGELFSKDGKFVIKP
ncbi:MAG TPA: aminopeptidase [Ktedonobacteraceae bacterium]|nr:aminopeptidase [Ktedonobacteraceae bacterium]